mgnify:CR=1 FL=1
MKKILLIAKWKKTKVQLQEFKSQIKDINTELNNKKDQLINSLNEKECIVEVEFTVGQKDYKIIRR